MRKILLGMMLWAPVTLFAQVDHWESVILEGEDWNYLLPTSEPSSTWKNAGFNDAGWQSGPSGFGYGDGDDNTTIGSRLSIYLRKDFTLSNLNEIEEAVLHMDYDDGFIAYLNGVEIARAQLNSPTPTFNQPSDGLHEALLYQGLTPESFSIDPSLLQEGTNTLAIQVHNQSLTSSDMSAIPVLSVGVNVPTMRYQDVPSWFLPPLNFTSSELPIVIINTSGGIPDEPKVAARFGIIYNGEGQINRLSDPWNEYDGHAGIEIRGSSSQSFPKKNYGIETWDAQGNDIDTTFLNFPSEEDWALHGPYSDKSLLNNVLAMKLANDLGRYSPRTRLVELVINGDYRGVYVIMERIKRDKNRVDIAKLNPDEVSGDDLSGGYIFRIDRSDSEQDRWISNYRAFGSDEPIRFIYDTPDPDDIVVQQQQYLQQYVLDFENAMASPQQINTKGRHYSNYIDVQSFVDNFILNELSKDVDAYRLSTFFHKDKDSKGGKIKAGPYWDFNLAFGNGDYCGGDDTTGWEYYQCIGSSPFWWDVWFRDEIFTTALQCRWNDLRSTVLTTSRINQFLDSTSLAMSDAVQRNFQRWPVMGTYVWPNSPFYASAQSHGQVMIEMKNWISQRITWLDNNLPGEARECETYLNYEHELLVTSLEDENEVDIRLFPNPSDGVVSIRATEMILSVQVVTLKGAVVFEAQPLSINFSQRLPLNDGVYIVRVKTTSEFVNHKLIIR